MGASPSIPLEAITTEEVAEAVANLGDRYQGYYEALVSNGIDGSLLQLLLDDSSNNNNNTNNENPITQVEETLDDLNITNRLHRRVLIKELDRQRALREDWERNNNDKQHQPYDDDNDNDIPEVTGNSCYHKDELYPIDGYDDDDDDLHPTKLRRQQQISLVHLIHRFQTTLDADNNNEEDADDQEAWRRRMVKELAYQSQLRKQLLRREELLRSQLAE